MYTDLTEERALLAMPHLVDAAQRGELLTYGQLAEKVGCHHRVLSYPLAYVRDEICDARDLPWLSVLVVLKNVGYPGAMWLPGGTDDLSPEQIRLKFETECKRVFAHQGWDELLRVLGLPCRD